MFLHTCYLIFSNQAFIKRLQYDSLSGTFKDFTGKTDFDFQQLQPSQDAEADAKEREKAIAWVKRERLPLFLKYESKYMYQNKLYIISVQLIRAGMAQ